MNIYTFQLYRRVPILRISGSGFEYQDVIISTFDLDRECEDPFRERMKLCRDFPGWAIGSDFKSGTDRDYETLVDPDLGKYGGTIDVGYNSDVNYDNPPMPENADAYLKLHGEQKIWHPKLRNEDQQ